MTINSSVSGPRPPTVARSSIVGSGATRGIRITSETPRCGEAYCHSGIHVERMAHRAEPVFMTRLLMRVSGVTLLEDGLKASKPGYRASIARTSAFFPSFPRVPR